VKKKTTSDRYIYHDYISCAVSPKRFLPNLTIPLELLGSHGYNYSILQRVILLCFLLIFTSSKDDKFSELQMRGRHI
jgi:hypothetical protein